MRAAFGNSEAVATEIGCQFRPGTDRIVKRPIFPAVCKVIWPENTDAHVAAVAGCSVRSAARWLSGEIEPPIPVVLAVINEIFARR